MEHVLAPMGHNYPPLSIDEILNGDEAPTDAEVLEALAARWRRNNSDMPEIAERAKSLAANKSRLPEQLDHNTIEIALDLLARLDTHEGGLSNITSGLPAQIKAAAKSVDASVKELTAGFAPLEKALRSLITDWLERDLAAKNAANTTGAPPLSTNARLGRSGARAAISMASEIRVSNPDLVPREWCSPDLARITAAIEGGAEIPGVETVPTAQLRITWPEAITRKAG